MHDIAVDLYVRPQSSVHMSIESQSRTLYLKAILMYALSVTVDDIFAVEICINLTVTFRMGKNQM